MKLTSFLHPPPHPHVSPSSLASLFLFPPLAFIFPFFSSPSFLLYVCLLKPKWLSFQRLRVCGARCCLDISISRGGGLCWGFVSAPASQGTRLFSFTTDAQQGDTCFRSLAATQIVSPNQSSSASHSNLL